MTEQRSARLGAVITNVTRRRQLKAAKTTKAAKSTKAAKAAPRSSVPTVALAVRAPATANPDSARVIATRITALVVRTGQQLGLPMKVSLHTAEAETDAYEIFLDRRPVALVPLDDGDTPDVVVATTHQALMRRLPLLLHDSHVNRLASRLHLQPHDRARAILGYILSNGVDLRRLPDLTTPAWADDMSPAEVAEVLLDQVEPSLRISVPQSILANLSQADVKAMPDFRENLLHTLGAHFPHLDLAIDSEPGAQPRIFLNDVEAPSMHATTSSSWTELVSAITDVILDHIAWFVRVNAVVDAKARTSSLFYDLVDISDGTVSNAELAACLRCLLADHDSIRNLPRILWQLIEATQDAGGLDEVLLAEPHLSAVTQSTEALHPDPEVSASEVRQGIAYEDWTGGEPPARPVAVTVPLEVEIELVDAADAEARGAAEWRMVRAVHLHGHVEVVATHAPAGIARTRQALYCLPIPPRVIASRELPPDTPPPALIEGGRSGE